MVRQLIVVLFLCAFSSNAWAQWFKFSSIPLTPTPTPEATAVVLTPSTGEWAEVEKILGRKGWAGGEGFKIIFPRMDINLLVQGVPLDSTQAFRSWFSFQPLPMGAHMEGQLALLDSEVPKVEKELVRRGFQLVDIYDPFLGETPAVKLIRFNGQGLKSNLAQNLRQLLYITGTPAKPEAEVSATPCALGTLIENSLGKGRTQGKTLAYDYARTEKITLNGLALSRESGLETVIYCQGEGKESVFWGHLVLTGGELPRVTKILSKNQIETATLHREFLNSSPELFFLNFLAFGDPVLIANGLKEALDQMSLEPRN